MLPIRYTIPAVEHRSTIIILNSRFIATGAYAPTVAEAEAFVARIRAEFPDANHHCIAYRVGYGFSAAERASDDGEPSGTAGRPMMAILQGAAIGDIAVVVTRYFGGIKLGTGGLVRAYSEAVRRLLSELPTRTKVQQIVRTLVVDYSRFQVIRNLIISYEGEIEAEQFAADVTFTFKMAVDQVEAFDTALTELSHGQLGAV